MKSPLLAIVPGLIALTALLAVGANQSNEQQTRGEPVNGLRLQLSADNVGDAVVFTTTLTKVSEQEFPVYLGSRGNPFEDGTSLVQVAGPNDGTGKDKEVAARWPTQGIAWGAVRPPPKILVLSPGESVIFQASLTLQNQAGQPFFPIGKDELAPLDAPPGLQRFRMVYRHDNAVLRFWNDRMRRRFFLLNREKAMEEELLAGLDGTSGAIMQLLPKVEKKPPTLPMCWAGTVRSNDVFIYIATGARP